MKLNDTFDPIRRALVIGGLGQVGKLFSHSMCASGLQVTIVDSRPLARNLTIGYEAPKYLQDDISSPSTQLISELQLCDCVCLCLPEQVTLKAVESVLPHLSEGCLWVDTLSVKTEIARALRPYSSHNELLSLNPMFSPALGWVHNAVAAAEINPGPKSRAFCELISSWGAHVIPISADEHDQLTAAIQVATHAAALAFGYCLAQLDFDIVKATQLATPPHRLLLSLLLRITQQNSEVYWDIQTWHPDATAVRDLLAKGLTRIQQASSADGHQQFKLMIEDIREVLEPASDVLSEWSRKFFAK